MDEPASVDPSAASASSPAAGAMATLAAACPHLARLPAPLPIWHGIVDAAGWTAAADAVAAAKGRLVSLWGGPGGHSVCAAWAVADGLAWLELPLAPAVGAARYPDLSTRFACANRLQRAVADLSGLDAEAAPDSPPADRLDTRPWLDHGLWPAGFVPLAGSAKGAEPPPLGATIPAAEYPFVRVEGDGVHEIAVGPVHAGIIEPGHFRFSVVGEKVLRLEQQLGWVHKGIERRFTALAPLQAHRLAGRVSGDSTVAFGWAYCMALESAWQAAIPARAQALRALLLERERVANHLGDLGALGNDAALAFGLAQFSRLRELWQRLSAEVFGHRLLMDVIVPGGVAVDPTPAQLARIAAQCDAVEAEVLALRRVYDEHAGLQDRFLTTGRVSPALAARLGLTGLAGRASGIANDLRSDQRWPPYDALAVRKAGSEAGDVAARVAVRFDEGLESLRLLRALCTAMPRGAARIELKAPAASLAASVHSVEPAAASTLPLVHTASSSVNASLPLVHEPGASFEAGRRGLGWVEGWRGEVLVALDLSPDGRRIVRAHCHDPSWQNWPVLEHAVIGNIVPDFPLINKSFNLSYSGQDL